MHAPTEYRTSDIYFAAYLRVAGVPLLRTERDPNTRRMFFVLEEAEGFQDLKAQYFSRTAKVVALNYVDEIRNLKTLLYA